MNLDHVGCVVTQRLRQISRLKTIKRTMCGRAKFDLLRHRILEAA